MKMSEKYQQGVDKCRRAAKDLHESWRPHMVGLIVQCPRQNYRTTVIVVDDRATSITIRGPDDQLHRGNFFPSGWTEDAQDENIPRDSLAGFEKEALLERLEPYVKAYQIVKEYPEG